MFFSREYFYSGEYLDKSSRKIKKISGAFRMNRPFKSVIPEIIELQKRINSSKGSNCGPVVITHVSRLK